MIKSQLKLAVASKDGIAISEHFGHAKQFWIYEVTPAQCHLLEKRTVEHYCLGNHASKTAMDKILETIKDCDAVFVVRIGEGLLEKLQGIGVQCVSEYAFEAIEPALLRFAQAVLAKDKPVITAETIEHWLKAHPLTPIHVDCATAVMLKILDGKCKMNIEEKTVMALLYEQVKQCPGQLLKADIHALITDSYNQLDEESKNDIYEQRLLAETMISRPVMKGFKAMIREQGLFKVQP